MDCQPMHAGTFHRTKQMFSTHNTGSRAIRLKSVLFACGPVASLCDLGWVQGASPDHSSRRGVGATAEDSAGVRAL